MDSVEQKDDRLSKKQPLKEERRQLRILLSGLDNSGKTTLLRNDSIFQDAIIGRYDQIIVDAHAGGPPGADIGSSHGTPPCAFSCRGDQVHVYDLGGSMDWKPLKKIQGMHQPQTVAKEGYDCILWVMDSCDRRRFEEQQYTLRGLLEATDATTTTSPLSILRLPLLVVANKQDLATAMSSSEVLEHTGIKDLLLEERGKVPRNCTVLETSFKYAKNVEEIGLWLHQVRESLTVKKSE